MVRPTINSEKHIVQRTFLNAAVGTVRSLILAQATSSITNSEDVRIGAVVKAVYVELWFAGEGAAAGTSICILEKLVAGQAAASTAQMLALHTYPNKKNVLFTHQGLTSFAAANAVPVMRGWYKIPKGKQRMGQGDTIQLTILSQVDGFNMCGVFIYKEYF